MNRVKRSKSMAIVADGRQRALAAAAGELAARRASIEAAIEEKYAPRFAEAGLIRRCWLWLRMNWEIYREQWRVTEKVAPRGALYAAMSVRKKETIASTAGKREIRKG